ncbi:hypothetical protein Tco_0575437 [Tanacetum coccineum]
MCVSEELVFIATREASRSKFSYTSSQSCPYIPSIIESSIQAVGLDCLTRIASVAICDVTPLCYFADPSTTTLPHMFSSSPLVLTMTPDTHHHTPQSEIPSAIWCTVFSHCLLQVGKVERRMSLLHSMDGGVSVDVPWHVAKFLCDKAKGSKRKSPIVGAHLIGKIASYYGLMTLGSLMNVTLGSETSSMSVAKLVDLGICRYNGLGIGEMVAEIPEVAGDDDVRAGQAEIGGVGCHPNMSNANRLRAMDEMLGEIVNDVDELTYVVSGMSEHYDQFYGEFGQWQTEQESNCLNMKVDVITSDLFTLSVFRT